MKSLNSFFLILRRKKSELGLGVALLFILLLSPLGVTQGKSVTDRYNMTRIYSLDISTCYDNTTTDILGTQVVTFTSQDVTTILGYISWNLTWDEGITWSYTNITQIYGTNRTYQIAGVPLFTAWWIDPSIDLGYNVKIDGDAPATDQLLRSTPFQVTDLVSYTIDNQCFICWLLRYETVSGQQESFYYERMTGVLVAAQSILTNQDSTSHEIFVELKATSSSLPQADIFANLWFSYGTLVVSIVLATISTLGAYLLLKHVSQRSVDQRYRLESSKRLKK
jgi:hypothetical protein